MFNRRISLISALFAMVAFAGQPLAPRERTVRAERKARNRKRYSRNSYGNAKRSGIGDRECARRMGGAHWEAFKDGDRVRRGLPVEIR